jgi:hypothetical protein
MNDVDARISLRRGPLLDLCDCLGRDRSLNRTALLIRLVHGVGQVRGVLLICTK